MKTPFLGGAYAARSRNLAYNRLVNLYPETAPPHAGEDMGALLGAPGLSQIFQVGDGPIRGILNYFNVTLFFVSGDTLYYTDSLSVTPIALGTIAGTGRVSMVANLTNQVFVVASPKGYIYDLSTSTLTEHTELPPLGGTCDFIDGYFVFEELGTAYFYIWDGGVFDPADVFTAEGEPSHITTVLADHSELWLFKQLAAEVWQDTGDVDATFQRMPGGLINQGCAAKFTPKRLDNSIYWLGRNEDGHGIVWRANGYTPARASDYALEFAIQSYGDISDAFALTYQQEGHAFYMLTFPSADATWVLDVSTGLWHERASLNGSTGELGRWRGNVMTFFQDEIVTGDATTGKVFTLSLDTYTDGSYGPLTGFDPATLYEVDSGTNDKLAAARIPGTPTGYLQLEILTLVGGTYTTPAKVMVVNDTLGGTSPVTVVAIVDVGDYTVTPSNPVDTTGGSGSGLVVWAQWTTGDAVAIAPETGSGYSTVAVITLDETYGSGASATCVSQLINCRPSGAGSGYVLGDVLTLLGGTGTPATVKVAELSGSTPLAYQIVDPGSYTVPPTGLRSLLGGSGTLATCTGFWGMGQWTLADAGEDYSRVPTVYVNGVGVGASLTAVVDATTNWIKAIRSWRAIPQGQNNLKRSFQHALQLYCQSGVGIDGTGQGTDPIINLRWSDDGGHTWTSYHQAKLGKIGETAKRVIWRRLGSTEKLRDRVYEISVTDPVKRAFIGADIDISAGVS